MEKGDWPVASVKNDVYNTLKHYPFQIPAHNQLLNYIHQKHSGLCISLNLYLAYYSYVLYKLGSLKINLQGE